MKLETYRIAINGTVQGVGFRPFIYQLATALDHGTVSNGTQGVEIVINTNSDTLKTFIQKIEDELPLLASIDTIKTTEIAQKIFADFQIISTDEEGKRTVRIPPDVSICKECEAELFDPNNRRYSYPFITCTH